MSDGSRELWDTTRNLERAVLNTHHLRSFVLLLGLLLAWDLRAAQLPASSRIVAIGDIHADMQALRRAFQAAGATDGKDNWIGGTLTVVQLGDLIGRADDERAVLDFIFSVQRKAAERGGAVHALIGNHEVMGARVDNQAVGPNPFPAWETVSGLRRDDPRLRHLPPEERARGAALMAGGPYARRIAAFPTVLKIRDIVFAHGGVPPRWATYGIDQINREVRDWLMGLTREPDSSLGVDDGDRVMWTRQFSREVEADDCRDLAESLRILDARRMIVAHTVHEQITPRCDGQVWTIDVGMSRAYGGRVQVLEIVDGRPPRVIVP